MAQPERNVHSKNRDKEKLNGQFGIYTCTKQNDTFSKIE